MSAELSTPRAPVAPREDHPSDSTSRRPLAPWLLIALTPVLLVITTSNPFDPGNIVQDLLRRYGIPVAVVEIVVIAYAVLSGIRPISSLSHMPRALQAALAILLAIAFAAAVQAAVPRLAYLHLSLSLIHLLFGLCLAGLAKAAPRQVGQVFWPAVVACLLIYAAILAVYVALVPDPARFDWLRFGFGVVNIRHTGFFATVGISASLGLALNAALLRSTMAWAVAASVFFALAFWAGSRGTLIPSWAAVLVILVLFKGLRNIRSIAIVIATSILGLLLSRVHHVENKHYGLERLQQVMGSGSLDSMASGRLEVWRGTWKAVLEHPWIGHGQGQLRFVVPEARPLEIYHPHNSVLQLAFEWGIPGAACFAVLVLCLCWHCWKKLDGDPGHSLPAFLVVAALLLMSLHDGALFFTYPIFMIAVAFAWLAAMPNRTEETNLEGRRLQH